MAEGKTPKLKLPYSTFVEVTWDDAVATEGWVEASSTDLTMERMVTRGWLIKETPEYIVIANSIKLGGADLIGGTNVIPRGMIVAQQELKVSNARSKL